MGLWIQDMKYGSIRIDGKDYHHDVILHSNGRGEHVNECGNALKGCCNASSKITLECAKEIYKQNIQWQIVGSGKLKKVDISKEAIEFLLSKKCKVFVLPTPEAIKIWNLSKGPAIGFFHLTC